jgi:hypothetical protein
MPTRTSIEPAQGHGKPYNIVSHISNLRLPFPRQPCSQCTARDSVHLWPTKLPPRTMPAQYRPLLAVRHGSFRCWRTPW